MINFAFTKQSPLRRYIKLSIMDTDYSDLCSEEISFVNGASDWETQPKTLDYHICSDEL